MKHSAWVAAAAAVSTLAVLAVASTVLIAGHVITSPWQQPDGHGAGHAHAAGLRLPLPHITKTVTPPPPSPVSTTVSLTSRCVVGYIPTGQGAVFVQGQPRGQTLDGTYYPPVPGYQLTLINIASATADVNGFAVVFYDSTGTELGSDQETAAESFITSGQSLTWDEYSGTDADGNSDSLGHANVPAGAATCQLVQWDHP